MMDASVALMNQTFMLSAQYSSIAARFPSAQAAPSTNDTDDSTAQDLSTKAKTGTAAEVAAESAAPAVATTSTATDEQAGPSSSKASEENQTNTFDENMAYIEDIGPDDLDRGSLDDTVNELRRRRLEKFERAQAQQS